MDHRVIATLPVVKRVNLRLQESVPAGAQGAPQFDGRASLVAVFGDRATCLYRAPLIRDSVVADTGPVDAVLHLGDVYCSGWADGVGARFSAMWPTRPGALSRGRNGNHEMYCGGQTIASEGSAWPAGAG